jgi:hypothetical protein
MKRVRKTEDDYLAERRKRRQTEEWKRGDAEAEVARASRGRRAADPEAERTCRRAYWVANRKEPLRKKREYRTVHREEVNRRDRAYRAAHRKAISRKDRERRVRRAAPAKRVKR